MNQQWNDTRPEVPLEGRDGQKVWRQTVLMAVQCVRTYCRSPAHLKWFKSQVVCDIHVPHTNKRRGKQEGEAAAGERAWGDRLLTDTSTSPYQEVQSFKELFPHIWGQKKVKQYRGSVPPAEFFHPRIHVSPRFHSWINEVPRAPLPVTTLPNRTQSADNSVWSASLPKLRKSLCSRILCSSKPPFLFSKLSKTHFKY